MSPKVISKENVFSMTTMSPLAGAVAFAMALPGLASAENFSIASQADLDTAITFINEQSSEGEGGPVKISSKGQAKELEIGDESHSITFESSLSGQTLDLPSFYIEGYGVSVEIDGSGASNLSLNMSAGYSSNHVVGRNANLSISDVSLNVERGNDPGNQGYGFGVYNEASLELDDVTLNLNTENGSLTAIYAGNRTSVSIQDSSLIGGGLISEQAAYEAYVSGDLLPGYSALIDSGSFRNFSISSSTVTGFTSKYGAVIELDGHYSGYSQITISDTTISNNRSLDDELVYVEVEDYSDVNIQGSVFSNNVADDEILYLDVDEYSTISILDSVFSSNDAGDELLQIEADDYVQSTIHNSVFSNNEAGDEILDLYGDSYSEFTISATAISNNESDYSTVYIDGDSENYAYIFNTSIHSNKVLEGEGYASLKLDGELNAVLGNVTIAGNQGFSAIYTVDGDVDLALAHVTIADNNTVYEAYDSVYTPGEGWEWIYYDVDAPALYIEAANNVVIVNSIISNNSGVDIYVDYLDDDLYIENSLVGEGEGFTVTSALAAGDGNIVGEDPMLSTLISGKGFAAGLRLRKGSPAIDAGTNDVITDFADFLDVDVQKLTDQSGYRARVINEVPDMGAFEWTEPSQGAAPGNPSASSSKGLFGNMGFGFLSGLFTLGWLRRKIKK